MAKVPISLAVWKRTSVTHLSELLAEQKTKSAAAEAGTSSTAAAGSIPIEELISSLAEGLAAEEDFLPVKSLDDIKALKYVKRHNEWGGKALVIEDNERPLTDSQIQEILNALAEAGIKYKELGLDWKTARNGGINLNAYPIIDPADLMVPVVGIPVNDDHAEEDLIQLIAPIVIPDEDLVDPIGPLPQPRSNTFSLSSLIQLSDPDEVEVTSGRRLSPLPTMEEVAKLAVNELVEKKDDQI